MKTNKSQKAAEPKLHPKNRHHGRYDIKKLVSVSPNLKSFVQKNPKGQLTVDFHDPAAVVALNQALLKTYYGIQNWSIPKGYLCPPIPGRADYLHYLHDLLSGSAPMLKNAPQKVQALDIGTGANVIYPLLGCQLFQWSFVASDVDGNAVQSAARNVAQNPQLKTGIQVRQQTNKKHIFKGIIKPNEYFHLTLCNPPFHASKAEAVKGTERKISNLTGGKGGSNRSKATLNFGGQSNELWCDGGELAFVRTMIRESAEFKRQVAWFTCLVSKAEHVSKLKRDAKRAGATDIRVVKMRQGQKVSRFIAWTFIEVA